MYSLGWLHCFMNLVTSSKSWDCFGQKSSRCLHHPGRRAPVVVSGLSSGILGKEAALGVARTHSPSIIP